ncbi:MAG: HAD family phosphatase [Muribaculaceae bacterium]|nr:HAD family phosphatase [Muribaculaceae bacterium]
MNNIGFLFDLDGVLIDSEREYSKIWSTINREFPTGVKSLEKIIKGCTLDKILNDFYPEKNIQTKVAARLHELEQKMKYRYLPGSKEFLDKLSERKLKKALVTSSDNTKMRHLKEEIPELLDYFDFIVTADLVTESKPSPQGYLAAAKKIDRKIKNCVVFEDSLQGVMAGRNAGAYVIGIYGTLPGETLSPYSDMIIGSLSEIVLENLIEKLETQ